MAKKHEEINPGVPIIQADPQAWADLVAPMRAAILARNPSFRGAVRGKPIPPADFGKVALAARAEPCGLFTAQALTVACGLYWDLAEERS
jgi:hypothetical protein